MILATFNLQVTLTLPFKFWVNWPFCSEEVQNRFSWWRPYWISDQIKFSYFWSTSHPDTSCQVSSQLVFWFRWRSAKNRFFYLQVILMLPTKFWVKWPFASGEEKDFQDGGHGGHLGFPIRRISATFDLLATPLLPTRFQDNWPFGSEEAKNRFSGHLAFPIRTNLAIFDLQVTLMLPTQFQVNWPFGLGEEAKKIDIQDGSHCGHLGFPIRTILAVFDLQVTPMVRTKFQVNWPFSSGDKSQKRF